MSSIRVEIPANTLLFDEGDPPGSAFLIEEGQVEVAARNGSERIVICHLGPGDLLGEMAVIDDAPRTASARTVTVCRLTEIRRDQIRQRLGEADPVLAALIEGLLARYRSGLKAIRGAGKPNEPVLVQTAGPEPSAHFDKFRLESQLLSALENDKLQVLYQPLLDIPNGVIAGYEALTRWHHPERGPVSPAEFIALAEETSLIVPVGEYVLRQVCKTLVALKQRERLKTHFIAVNVSTRQLALGEFPDRLSEIVNEIGADPGQIKIEVTESMTLDFERVQRLLANLHACGFSVALDDFGTGYSSLARLHHLELDTIKLDQAFTRQMLEDERCMRIVEAIVQMAHGLGCDVVVEGIETQDQLDAVAAMGCRYGQGYLIGRPAAIP